MNGTRAREIRREAYRKTVNDTTVGEGAYRAIFHGLQKVFIGIFDGGPQYRQEAASLTIVCNGWRATYQHLKRAYKRSRCPQLAKA